MTEILIEVSDLYDAFYDIASIIWSKGGFTNGDRAADAHIGPSFGDHIDILEFDFFRAACARRLAKAGVPWRIGPTRIGQYLRLHDADGVPFEGEKGRYQWNTFDWGRPGDSEVDNKVVAGDLTVLSRTEARIFLHFEAEEPVT